MEILFITVKHVMHMTKFCEKTAKKMIAEVRVDRKIRKYGKVSVLAYCQFHHLDYDGVQKILQAITTKKS
jgi:hypothetical protein